MLKLSSTKVHIQGLFTMCSTYHFKGKHKLDSTIYFWPMNLTVPAEIKQSVQSVGYGLGNNQLQCNCQQQLQQQEIHILSKASRPALWSSQPPTQSAPRVLPHQCPKLSSSTHSLFTFLPDLQRWLLWTLSQMSISPFSNFLHHILKYCTLIMP